MKLPVLLLLCSLSAMAAEPANANEFFELKIRPLLVKNCLSCHASARMGGLQLDSRDHLAKGGEHGPVVIAGHADQSVLFQAVARTHPKFKMPPSGPLPGDDVAAIKTWIDGGAVWPDTGKVIAPKSQYVITTEQRKFWSFQPVGNPAPPAVRNSAWVKNPIDQFILAKLEAKGLQPARPADRRTLIRRATYDLIGLPPTPQEVDAFLSDRSPDAWAKVVDRLLASPHYGERWGRYWLDVARYSDDKLNSTKDDPYPNSFRYRDWVIQAFNRDMPYDQFVKAQIAGDLMPAKDRLQYEPGLGFYALSPEFQDDRVDATTRGFLGLTVACAQCHDHKYDPIPTQDYYSLLGIFANTELHEYPLAPEKEVEAWQKQKKRIDKKEAEIKEFVDKQSSQLADILATKTARFLLAAQGIEPAGDLDSQTLRGWKRYLARKQREHPFLKNWDSLVGSGAAPDELRKAAQEFQDLVLAVNAEKKLVDEKNHITLGLNPSREDLSKASLVSLDRDKYVLWRDLFQTRGVLRPSKDEIECYLSGEWKQYLETMDHDLAALRKELPPQYPFLQVIQDHKKIAKQRVWIRGDRNNPGDDAPPRFLAILAHGERKVFTQGSGRLELAEAIADRNNPLTARVMVNRIWQHHFGQGIVRTPSNFGELGDRPSHPELLDHLASWFTDHNWSMKALHRQIMLSAAYQESAEYSEKSFAADPENRLLWRANRRRLDIEALRDSLLFVSGNLDLTEGGKAVPFGDENSRRTVYGFVSRRKLDRMLALFDFPNANNTSEQRMSTNVPLQRLFYMNGSLVAQEAQKLAARLADEPDDRARIRKAYRWLFDRDPDHAEVDLGLQFLRESREAWPQYTQVLLSSNEFIFVE
ncbi:MAG TPA: PSD1 and planctomycete cytochrome C domain-containing protein [Bryobacteraceae bacterium]|nr:PSD1 and planctomycete cytochrome C domain-containing protein [Bryobacteraceae bacterium]